MPDVSHNAAVLARGVLTFIDVCPAPPHYAAAFHDITVGNNSFDGVPGFNAAPGWDAASGLGSPQAPGLVDLLNQLVSPGDGESAIAQSPVTTNNSGSGHAKPH